jgi:hypothetical protein
MPTWERTDSGNSGSDLADSASSLTSIANWNEILLLISRIEEEMSTHQQFWTSSIVFALAPRLSLALLIVWIDSSHPDMCEWIIASGVFEQLLLLRNMLVCACLRVFPLLPNFYGSLAVSRRKAASFGGLEFVNRHVSTDINNELSVFILVPDPIVFYLRCTFAGIYFL